MAEVQAIDPPAASGEPSETQDVAISFADRLRAVNATLASLSDCEYEGVGRRFLIKMALAGARETIHDRDSVSSYFRAFSGRYCHLFSNTIMYSRLAAGGGADLLAHKVHEGLHALQVTQSPAFYLRPLTASPFMLAPLDFLHLMLHKEREAYAKQVWLSSLAEEIDPEYAPDRRYTPMSSAHFIWLRTRSPNLQVTLKRAAEHIERVKIIPRPGQPEFTLQERYLEAAQTLYFMQWRALPEERSVMPVVVRLEPRDIWMLGRNIGPNMFGLRKPDRGLLDPFRLTASARAFAKYISCEMRLPPHEDLPTMSQAFAAASIDPSRYVAQHRGRRVPEAPANPDMS